MSGGREPGRGRVEGGQPSRVKRCFCPIGRSVCRTSAVSVSGWAGWVHRAQVLTGTPVAVCRQEGCPKTGRVTALRCSLEASECRCLTSRQREVGLVLPWGSDLSHYTWGALPPWLSCHAGDLALIPGLGRSPGERKGYPLQCSGLENSVNSIVQGVAKSRTRLSDFHFRPR